MEETQKTIIITKINNNDFCIDILKNGYNFIEKTIYNTKHAKHILKLLEKYENE